VDVDSRRLELLKLEGLGFSQAEIVKELSVKCASSERTVKDGRIDEKAVVNP